MTFRYVWIVDEIVVLRRAAAIDATLTRYVRRPPAITKPGPHTVTLRVTAPVTAQRTVTVEVCP